MKTKGNPGIPGSILVFIAGFMFLSITLPLCADDLREFQPIPRTDLYDREFMADFYDALDVHLEGLTWVEESGTTRLLVEGGVNAERGDVEGALTAFGAIPDSISSNFPFLATMHEDLLVPQNLDPWYDFVQAREMLFTFYEETWLPHPEYRDDYMTFKQDTIGRASRRDPTVPAVWILGHLSDYGFIADQALSEDDPYLFLWNLLTELSYYAQRANYYYLQWDNYNPGDYEKAVLGRVGEIIRRAHDEAARSEMGHGFWADLISSHTPFEAPTTGVESTGEIFQPIETLPASHTGVSDITTETVEETDHRGLFEPPTDVTQPVVAVVDIEERYELIESLIEDIKTRLGVEDITEEIPDEFRYEPVTEPTQSESVPEAEMPVDLGDDARMRLQEIANQLAIDISALASDLGRETIDLVVLYNDVNVSDETIENAEARYIAKREAFLAGLAVWDRFDMEIFSPLTLTDFNDLIIADLRGQYEEVKSNSAQWSQYQAYEAHFEEALGQIESGVRDRRDQQDVLAAEAAALTAFLGDYNVLIKEIEDLLAGTAIEPAEAE